MKRGSVAINGCTPSPLIVFILLIDCLTIQLYPIMAVSIEEDWQNDLLTIYLYLIEALFYLKADKENDLIVSCSSSFNMQGLVGRNREGVVILHKIQIPMYILTLYGGMFASYGLSGLYKWAVECTLGELQLLGDFD